MAVCATIRACAAAPTPHSAAPVVAVRADAARALGVCADRRTAPAVIGATAAALLALFVAWPLLLVLARGATHWAELAGGAWLGVLARSLAVAAVSTAVAVALGSGLAYAVTRADVPGKRLVAIACRLPAVLPPFFAALALLLLFGDGGLVVRAVGWRAGIAGFGGVVVAQTVAFLPDAFLVMVHTFRRTDDALEEAALNLGAGALATARDVTLALARPGLVWAALSVFVLCLSDFGNPFLIGGDFGVFTTEIYVRAARAHDLGGAAALSVPLIVPCLVAHALTAGWLGAPPRPSRWTIHFGAGRRLSSRARGLVVAAAAGSALALLCLYGGIALASIVRLSGTRPRLSLMHYRELGGAAGTSPIVASLVLALLAAGVGGVLATAIGRLATRPHAVAVTLIERWARLPAALPGTVLGVGYLLAFGGAAGPRAGAIWILAASIVFGKLPRAVSAAIELERSLPPALEEVARSLGAGPVRTFGRVTLPCLLPAGVATFVELFIDGVATVSALVLLVPAGFVPLSVASLGHARQGDLGLACALGTVLGALSLCAVGLYRRAVDRSGA